MTLLVDVLFCQLRTFLNPISELRRGHMRGVWIELLLRVFITQFDSELAEVCAYPRYSTLLRPRTYVASSVHRRASNG